jgi:LmbE family N-acetylglucosaminyl deacetylase
MPDESPKTKPEKLPKAKTELEALVLAELRAASQCGGAVHVTVVAYDDYRVGATWEVASCDAGTSAPEACERALCDIIRRLQQHFDIASA